MCCKRMLLVRKNRTLSWSLAALLALLDSGRSLTAAVPPIGIVAVNEKPQRVQPALLAGDWAGAKEALRNPDCCVVSVSGLESPLRVLQEQWANTTGHAMMASDIDLRARVRVDSSSASDDSYKDCLRVCRAVSGSFVPEVTKKQQKINVEEPPDNHEAAVVAALQELACGISTLNEEANGPPSVSGRKKDAARDIFLRIVVASRYKARDPMFHTDKAPLRGYVTLLGPGTDFMTRPSTPMEYLTLRSLGSPEPGDGDDCSTSTSDTLRRADVLEFIVMKGDRYLYDLSFSSTKPSTKVTTTNDKVSYWMRRIRNIVAPDRTCACVHRSPPADAATGGGRRIILSFDLADGDDDREWFEVNKRREWRSGMTQRKSHLVA